MKALDKAMAIWEDPEDMIAMWELSPSKLYHEELVASWVGNAGRMVDLGCGAGRYANALKYESYVGYDANMPMLIEAQRRHPKLVFSTVDIFSFTIATKFDTLLMIDVAHHQEQPVDSILRIMELWHADRYFFTLLVGDKREDLYASTVVPFSDLLCIMDNVDVVRLYVDHCGVEPFAWVLIEVRGEP